MNYDPVSIAEIADFLEAMTMETGDPNERITEALLASLREYEVGEVSTFRRCSKCNIVKPFEKDFPYNAKGIRGFNHICRKCRNKVLNIGKKRRRACGKMTSEDAAEIQRFREMEALDV